MHIFVGSRRDFRVSAGWRLVAGLVLALLATVQLLPALHHALVRHVVCPEHGELAHELSARHEHESAPAEGGAGYRATAAEAGHDHCGLLAGVREHAFAPPAVVEVSRAAPSSSRAPVVETSARNAIELLALAPKQSPPRG